VGGPAAPELHSPMPGTVAAVPAATGDRVEEGQTVVVVEAMKMEHRLTAPTAGTAEVLVRPGEQVRLHQLLARVAPDDVPGSTGPELHSPMPGTVAAVPAATGDRVAEGQTVVVVEAMKMEHRLTAPTAGTAEVLVRPGEQVRLHQLLARVAPDDVPGNAGPGDAESAVTGSEAHESAAKEQSA